MHIERYQTLADETAIYPGKDELTGLLYATLGLTNEAGEVAGKVKKALRDDAGVISLERREALVGELGDVLWYVAAVATELDVSLEEVAARNLLKLTSRKERGVLGGDGDNR